MRCDCKPSRSDRDDAGLHLVLKASPEAVRAALAGLMRAPLLEGLDVDRLGTTELVLAEVLNNIVEHAYARHKGDIELTLFRSAKGLHCHVRDSGLPMPGERLPPGDPPPLEGDLPEGGFGWNLIRTLTTQLTYRRAAGRNHLQFLLAV